MLNLDNERYYGLDDVGSRMYSVLTSSESIEAAYELLVREYKVEGELLRSDLLMLVDKLLEQGLVEISNK